MNLMNKEEREISDKLSLVTKHSTCIYIHDILYHLHTDKSLKKMDIYINVFITYLSAHTQIITTFQISINSPIKPTNSMNEVQHK